MITSIQNRATIGKILAMGLLLSTLLAMAFSSGTAGAAVTSGKAFAWGYNTSGQLGNDTSGPGTDTKVPAVVKNLSGVKSVKAGCTHGLALKTDGTIRAWGENSFGQLGNGTSGPGTDSDLPVRVQIDNVRAISAGCDHNLALKENGTVWAWGYNLRGQLGNGTSGIDENAPVKVANIGNGAKGIAAGYDFSLALMQDGTVRSWGSDSDGQLGNGSDPSRDTPGPVSNLSNVKAIASDSEAIHALVLSNGGTVKSWGSNEYGQLGNGANLPGADATTPARIANLSGVEAVAAGGYHSLALMDSGTVWAWGYNSDGQLGNDTHGDGTDRSTPVSVIGLTNVRSISAGSYHTLAVLEGGGARSWGSNYYGELGIGTNGPGSEKDVPVVVKNLANVRNMDAGDEFTLASIR